jgi:hypothetical protein
MVDAIAHRLSAVRQSIAEAALGCSRQPDAVSLIAVSKGHGGDAIRAAYAAGQRDFGENYAREWRDKAAALADLEDLRWHFIGHLQRNKMKWVAGRVAMVHCIDNPAGLSELSRRAQRQGAVQATLLQVSLAGEANKRGCTQDQVETLLRLAADHPGVVVRGLMTMPPATTDAEQVRPWFRRLRTLSENLWVDDSQRPLLSMGMSADYRVAIEEGASHVRVGSAIFGPRPA